MDKGELIFALTVLSFFGAVACIGQVVFGMVRGNAKLGCSLTGFILELMFIASFLSLTGL